MPLAVKNFLHDSPLDRLSNKLSMDPQIFTARRKMGTGSFRSGRHGSAGSAAPASKDRHQPQTAINLAATVRTRLTARFYQLRDMHHDDAMTSTETLTDRRQAQDRSTQTAHQPKSPRRTETNAALPAWQTKNPAPQGTGFKINWSG